MRRVFFCCSYLRRIDSCITQLKAQGPSRTCNESKEEKKRNLAEHLHEAHLLLLLGTEDEVLLNRRGRLPNLFRKVDVRLPEKGNSYSHGARPVHKLPWREAGPPNHHDDKVDSDQ